jgi:ribosomal protein S18 acetylase RimI-like enzyme
VCAQQHLKSIMIKRPNSPEEWDLYFNLRYEVLRAPWNQPRGTERNEGDETAEHFAFFEEDEIIGVGRLDFTPNHGSQIRFMAVDNRYQGRGIGRQLMEHMEGIARNKGCKETILHAREIALPFYEKLGYSITEKSHLLFGEIQHFLMTKHYEQLS